MSSERALYQYLMEGYRQSVRPVRNYADPIDLKVDLRLTILEDLVRRTVTALVFVLARHFVTIIMTIIGQLACRRQRETGGP